MTSPGAEGHDTKLEDGWNREGLTTSDLPERDGSSEEKRKKKQTGRVGREPQACGLG